MRSAPRISPASPLDLEYRRGTRPRLLVGIGLALVSGLGALGERTPVTWAVSALLGGLAAYLVITGRARRGHVRFDLEGRSLTSTLHKRRVEGVAHVELVARSGDLEGRPRPSYAAEAVTDDDVRHEIYESGDPSDLLRWARRMDRVLPVRVAWVEGHPRVGEWLSAGTETGPGRPERPRRIEGASQPRRGPVTQLLVGIAVGLGIIWGIFLSGSKVPPADLSVALALGSILFVLLTAFLVATDHTVLEVDDEVRIERRRLGMSLTRLRIPLRDVRRVAALTPDGESGVLLLLTDDDVFSVPLAQPATEQAARALGP